MNIMPVPKYNNEYKQYRIFAKPEEKGIRANTCKSIFLPRHWWIKYEAENNNCYYINKKSAIKYINNCSNEILKPYSKKDSNPQILSKIRLVSLHKLADQGDAEAEFQLGSYYYDQASKAPIFYLKRIHQKEYSIGCKKSKIMKLAIEYYKRAADHNHVEAQNLIGSEYSRGTNIPQDFEKAKEYYTKAVNQNHKASIEALNIVNKLQATAPSRSNKFHIRFS